MTGRAAPAPIKRRNAALEQEKPKKRKLSKKQKIALTAAIIAAVAVVAVILFVIFGSQPTADPNREFEPGQTAGQNKTMADMLSIPGFESMTIEAGQTTVGTKLYNPEDNNCYFEISIVLADTDEEIYKSKLVSPGQTLYEIDLTRALDKGVYEAVVHYSTYALEDYADMNGANVPFELVVV